MTHQEHLKFELMKYGIENDYFAYGSWIEKKKNGTYVVCVDGEKFRYTATQLAEAFDDVMDSDKKEIINAYMEEYLLAKGGFRKATCS